MKIEEVVNKVKQGKLFLVGSFLSAKAEARTFRDRDSGKSRVMATVRTWLLADGQPVQMLEYKDDDFNPAGYAVPHKSGDQVAVEVQGFKEERGVNILRGILHPVTV